LRENKTIRNIQTRLSTEHNKIYKDAKCCQGDRDVALRKLQEIDAEMRALYKPFDIDERFEWREPLYEKFPDWVRYKTPMGHERVHEISRKEKVTAAHILYNKLRHKKSHLKKETEHEYIHSLTYWTERLAYLYEEECARILSPRESIVEISCGDRRCAAAAGECGGSSHE
jgi:hypothetical protein